MLFYTKNQVVTSFKNDSFIQSKLYKDTVMVKWFKSYLMLHKVPKTEIRKKINKVYIKIKDMYITLDVNKQNTLKMTQKCIHLQKDYRNCWYK